MRAMVLVKPFAAGMAGDTSFLASQVFHFLLRVSLKRRACTRMQRPRPSPGHLGLQHVRARCLRSITVLVEKRRGRTGTKDSEEHQPVPLLVLGSRPLPKGALVAMCWGLTVL